MKVYQLEAYITDFPNPTTGAFAYRNVLNLFHTVELFTTLEKAKLRLEELQKAAEVLRFNLTHTIQEREIE